MTTINGTYSLVTALQQLQSGFSTADTDGNKSLSQAEFTAAAKANPNLTTGTTAAAEFTKLDADKNGAISSTELTQGLNLESQVYSVLLQGQEIASGGAFMQLLNSSGSSSSSSLFGSSTDFSSLTSSLLGGGSSSTSLISMLSGGNANTTTLASLFGSSENTTSQLDAILAQYTGTNIEA